MAHLRRRVGDLRTLDAMLMNEVTKGSVQREEELLRRPDLDARVLSSWVIGVR
jgi:hypothetical protein